MMVKTAGSDSMCLSSKWRVWAGVEKATRLQGDWLKVGTLCNWYESEQASSASVEATAGIVCSKQ